jgi:hypothetical protein
MPAQGMELPSGHNLPAGVYVGIDAAAMNRIEDIFGANLTSLTLCAGCSRRRKQAMNLKKGRLRMDKANLTFGESSRSCVGKILFSWKFSRLFRR